MLDQVWLRGRVTQWEACNIALTVELYLPFEIVAVAPIVHLYIVS